MASYLFLFALTTCLVKGRFHLLLFCFASMPFSALTIIPPDLIGGINFTVTSAGILALFSRAMYDFGVSRLLEAATRFDLLGILSIYFIWCCLSVIFFPRLFSGEILIYPVRSDGNGYYLTSLSFTSSNLTQLSYIFISYLASISAFVISDRGISYVTAKCAVAISIFVILTGSLDLLGFSSFLDEFKNASYSLASESFIASTRRVIGATPEASSFGSIASLSFAMVLFYEKFIIRKFVFVALLISNFLFAVLSTSSTAYLMIICAVSLYFAQQLVLLIVDRGRDFGSALVRIFIIICIFTGGAFMLFVSNNLRDSVFNLLDALIFNKSSSDSFEERTRWTRAAIDAFYSSHYVGIGIGSARTSNTFANILASTGVVGVGFLALFMYRIVLSSLSAARMGESWSALGVILTYAAGIAVAGTTPDYGPAVGIFFGLQVAVCMFERKQLANYPVRAPNRTIVR